MFASGGVEDDLRGELLEYGLHGLAIAGIEHNGYEACGAGWGSWGGTQAAHLAIDFVEGIFCALDEEDSRGAGGGDLADYFRADSAARAGDEHGLAEDKAGGGGIIEMALVALDELGLLATRREPEPPQYARRNDADDGKDERNERYRIWRAQVREGEARQEEAHEREHGGGKNARGHIARHFRWLYAPPRKRIASRRQ